MATHLGMVACMVVVAAMLLHGAAAADTYVVLDKTGWTVPASGDDSVYRTWAANKDFEVGDTLVFNFPAGMHNVAEVSKAGYDACNGAAPLSLQTTSPVNMTLRTNGQHYYICTVGNHCQGGQKLAITVEGSNGTATPTTPSVPSPPRSPSGSSSVSSIAVSGFTLLSTAIAFLF